MCLNLPVSLIYSVADGRLVGDDELFRVFLALDCGHEFVPLRSVLVVEDQKVVCALISVMFGQIGLYGIAACTG